MIVADLSVYFQEKQRVIDDALDSYLQNIDSGCPDSLQEAMRYSLLAPGKRLRPLLVLMSAEACGGKDEEAIPAACAVEMIHTYSLVHDDLPAMDDDDLRRGRPTCHKQFTEATAILVGDALLTYAFEILATSYPPRTATSCCVELAKASGPSGMVGGQVEDLAWEKRGGTLDTLIGLHGRKTGALFRASLKLGLLSAQGENPDGPDLRLMESLDQWGRCFGLVFQITDDLLDVEGTAEVTGKRVQKDAGRGKLTYPGIMGVNQSKRRASDLAREADSHLETLGEAGARLQALFRFVLERDR
ncbi:MAG: polyprenyl synthetase family protein [Gemmataceae bacterium]